LSNYTTTYDGGEKICLKCYVEREAPTHAKYVVFQSPIYMNALLSKHPLYIQSIFFKNIGLHIQNQNWGFSIGEIMNICLLNSHLLSWDGILDKQIFKEKNSEIIEPIYFKNMKTNPWFKQYKTIFEQSNDYLAMCVLSSNVVDDIFNKDHVSNHSFENMHVIDEVQNLSFLFDMC
jgi:hypothetical protein